MGLSRNKVAVSEGAAGSPPFYGESGRGKRNASDAVIFGNRVGRKSRRGKTRGTGFCLERGSCCSIINDQAPRKAVKFIEKTEADILMGV